MNRRSLKMADVTKKCCANCVHLDKRCICERYNIPLLNAASMQYSVCECFMPVSDKPADVIGTQGSKTHSHK